MNKLDLKIKTLVDNSVLTEKEQENILNAFHKMNPGQQISFVALIREDKKRLTTASAFLNSFYSSSQLSDIAVEDFLLSKVK